MEKNEGTGSKLYRQLSSAFPEAEKLSDEEGKLQLRVNREYIESIEISHIDPQPSKVTAGSRDVTFEFNLEKNRPAHIKIYYEFQEPGSHSLNLRAGNEAVINVNQFVYP
jgi:hypothetical protein